MPDEIKVWLSYDDNAKDIVDKINEALSHVGYVLQDDGREYYWYVLYVLERL